MIQKQPPRGILKKRCSENMQQIYRRTPMPKCDSIKLQSNFIEITLRLGCSPVNVLHIFRTPFPRYTSGWRLLYDCTIWKEKSCSSVWNTQQLFWVTLSGFSRTLWCVTTKGILFFGCYFFKISIIALLLRF